MDTAGSKECIHILYIAMYVTPSNFNSSFMHSYKYGYCPNLFTETCKIQWQNGTCAELCECPELCKTGLLIEKFLKEKTEMQTIIMLINLTMLH